MARAIWKGAIAFGLVNIPVGLSSAEEPDSEVGLHMVDKKNNARIRYKKVNAETGEEVPADRIVKGYEHEEGEFVLFDDKELEDVRPELTKTIEIKQFVDLADIEPLLYEKPYYLEPEKRGRKAYALLRETLRESGKAGVARVVIRTREYLAAMFVRDDAIVLELMRFPDEVRPASKLDLPASSDAQFKPARKEMELAKRLVDDMTEKWDPAEHHDEYQSALMAYIDGKIAKGATAVVKGGEKERESGGGTSGNTIDLAAYLEKSIMDGKRTKSPATTGKSSGKKSGARKSTARKTAKKAARKSAKKAAKKSA